MNERRDLSKEELIKRVAELEKHVGALEYNLIHDKLTGLNTRAFFEQEVSVYLEVIAKERKLLENGASERRERFGFRNLSVIFFDIDHFKKVNDTYGHDMGDIVLQEVAKTIQASLRTGDTVARWGGEEIIVSLLGASESDAALKAEEIRAAVEKLKFSSQEKLSLTISAGVSTAEIDITLHDLVKRADLALYDAKKAGRNRVVTYTQMVKLTEPAVTLN
jgi:two-component system, cell cycle response regulator